MTSRSFLTLSPDLVDRLVQLGKTVILVSNTPESERFGEQRYNRFDAFVFSNRRLPNAAELRELETAFYQDYQRGQSQTNARLQRLATQHPSGQVYFADRSEFMCVKEEERCVFYFPETKAKALWDYGHTTLDGAQAFAQRIDRIRWLSEVMLQSR